MPSSRNPAPPYPIAAVDNALLALQLVRERGSLRIADVSDALGIARSSAHRLLAMLAYRDFLHQDRATKAYRPGPALIGLGLAVVRDMDIRLAARPHMEILARDTGETVSLVVLDGARALFIDCVESAQPVRVGSRTGSAMPAHCTSAGKAILATLAPRSLCALYPDRRLEAMTKRSIADRDQLEAELAAIRRRGYATNMLESEDDIAAVGVAITTAPAAAFSVTGPAGRMTPQRIDRIARTLLEHLPALGAAQPS